ncbi:response regulator transcription factor [bacterium]|nr:response regulator transcription factor [bacterium]
MPGHLHIFYFLLTGLTGIASLAAAVVIEIRSRDPLIRRYLFFYTVYTGMIFLALFDLYARINIPDLPPAIEHITSYLLEFPVMYLMMFTVPFLMHHLFAVPGERQRNTVLGALIIMAFIGQHWTENAGSRALDETGDLLEKMLFAGIIVYAVITGSLYYGKVRDAGKNKFAFYFLLLLWIYTPGLIADMLFPDFFSVEFYPLLYCAYSIVFTRLLVRSIRASAIHMDSASAQHLLERYGISTREEAVIKLILQGYSNRKIGNTLFISQSTVKTHISNIFQKCGVKSRFELISLFSRKHGPSDLPF